MAMSREAQGWQISVIIFAILTVLLALTTYMFYSQAENLKKEMATAQGQKTQAEQVAKNLNYRLQAFRMVLGMNNVTEADVEAAKRGINDSPDDVTTLTADFKKDMDSWGAEVAAEGASKNYRTLPAYLLKVITERNKVVAEVIEREKKLIVDRDTHQVSETNRTAGFEKAAQTAQAELASQTATFQSDRQKVTEAGQKIAVQLAAKDKVIKEAADKFAKERETLEKQVGQYALLTQGLKEQVKGFRDDSKFESPDGAVTWVNQRQRLVWINLGLADGLFRQTTFSVYNHDQAGVTSAKPKASIEVIRITAPHTAECRILQDDVKNPIMPNDLIHTPVWSPGQEVRFALVGFMDIDGDGVSDREMIKRIITMNGGKIDAELKDDGTRVGSLNINTRYLVQGDKPNEKTGANVLVEYNNMLTEVQRFNVEVISAQKLLQQMGWKAEEKKVDYSGAKDLTGFKPRQPGGVAAEPGAKPAGPIEEVPAPATNNPGADPFGADPAPAAGAEVDPFK